MSETTIQTAPKKKLSERKGYLIYRRIRSILFTILLIAAVAILVVTMIARIRGETPSLFGYSIFRVSSGSMKPAYEVGDVILVKECDPKDLKSGDVVTYNGTEGEFNGKIVTHRVVKPLYDNSGDKYLVTRGDANPSDDPPIKSSQVIGKVETKIGILRDLYNLFVTPWGLLLIILLIIAAFFNEIVIFIKSILGIGYEEKEHDSIEEIIGRYQKENTEKKQTEMQENEEN